MSFRRLPPFSSIVAFESAARLLSFKAAAEELCLSPPAITYRIKELESILNTKLFIRSSRGLQLTKEGEEYYRQVTESLGQLQRATQDVSEPQGQTILKVQALPFLAGEVIIPRLAEFYQQHPDLIVHIDTKYALADFPREDVDIAIRFGLGDWPDLASEQLLPVTVSPVCSKHILDTHPIEKIDDLLSHLLIGMDKDDRNWAHFFQQVGRPDLIPGRQLFFSDYVMGLRAAENDAGIALGNMPLINSWLESGRLVQPLSLSWQPPQQYYLVNRHEDAEKPQIRLFKDWLKTLLDDPAT